MSLAFVFLLVRVTTIILISGTFFVLVTLINVMAEVSALAAFVLTKETTLGRVMSLLPALLTLSLCTWGFLLSIFLPFCLIFRGRTIFLSFWRNFVLFLFSGLLEVILLIDNAYKLLAINLFHRIGA